MTDSDLEARVLNKVLPKVQALLMVGIGVGFGADYDLGEVVGVIWDSQATTENPIILLCNHTKPLLLLASKSCVLRRLSRGYLVSF